MKLKERSIIIVTLVFFGLHIGAAQNTSFKSEVLKTEEINVKSVDTERISNYVLNIKLKRKPNSNKLVVTSAEYILKQTRRNTITQRIAAQKKRISMLYSEDELSKPSVKEIKYTSVVSN